MTEEETEMAKMTKEEKVAAVKEYRECRARMAELKKRNKNIGKEVFKDSCKSLFEQNPEIKSFEWRQYTPGWNDGDPCTFRGYSNDPYVNGLNEYGEDSGYEEPETPLTDEQQKQHKKLVKRVTEFMADYDASELEDWFGDCVAITVTPKGIETTDYQPY